MQNINSFARYLLLALIVAGPGLASADWEVSAPERQSAIARAIVWQAPQVPIASLNLLQGPSDRFGFNQQVECVFKPNAYARLLGSGQTEKFWCREGNGGGADPAPGNKLKVKYGAENGEVFAEVASTRLFWALGFFADTTYPVRVQCHGCPENPWGYLRRRLELAESGIADPSERVRFSSGVGDQRLRRAQNRVRREDREREGAVREFYPATIEKKLKGSGYSRPGKNDAGWDFAELNGISEQQGGSPRAHIDALKLLAAFVQHGDNKAQQQRLACPRENVETREGGQHCRQPIMMVQDLGATFGDGATGGFYTSTESKMSITKWNARPVWKDPASCQAYLPKSLIGSFEHPVVSEAGRQFLADLLSQLSDEQIADIFTAARASERQGVSSAGIAEWVAAFKERRRQIVEHRCRQ